MENIKKDLEKLPLSEEHVALALENIEKEVPDFQLGNIRFLSFDEEFDVIRNQVLEDGLHNISWYYVRTALGIEDTDENYRGFYARPRQIRDNVIESILDEIVGLMYNEGEALAYVSGNPNGQYIYDFVQSITDAGYGVHYMDCVAQEVAWRLSRLAKKFPAASELSNVVLQYGLQTAIYHQNGSEWIDAPNKNRRVFNLGGKFATIKNFTEGIYVCRLSNEPHYLEMVFSLENGECLYCFADDKLPENNTWGEEISQNTRRQMVQSLLNGW